MKISGIIKISLTILLAGGVAIAANMPALAKEPGGQLDQPEYGHQAQAKMPVAEVTISKKKHQWVITNIGDRYLVKHGTLITDAHGQQVALRELRIPCKAQVVYQNDQGVRKAHRIKIVSVSGNANSNFTSDMPE